MFANLLSKSTRAEFAQELERQKQMEQQKKSATIIDFQKIQQIENQVHNQAAQ